jgi:hypothetical protein
MTNAHSETGQIALCCQNLMLRALSSCSTLSVLFGMLFKKFGIFLNMPHIILEKKIKILRLLKSGKTDFKNFNMILRI